MQDRQIRYPYRQRRQVKSSEPTLFCLREIREVSSWVMESKRRWGGVRFFWGGMALGIHSLIHSFIRSINKDLKSDINLS